MTESDGPRRTITIEEAVTIAQQCQQRGDLDQAEGLYRRILELEPEQADALHYLGVLEQQRGRNEEALALIQRSLALVPDRADWHSNLGIVRQQGGDAEGAIEAYRRAIELGHGHANAYSNLGVLLRLCGRLEEAEVAYRRAIALNPEHADAYQNLAVVLSLTGRVPEAIVVYCRTLTLRPDFRQARRLLALAYCIIGEREKAILLCEEWIRLSPDDAVARHTLAAVSGREVPPRASDDYVRQVFNDFAETFEVKLERLQYQAPALVGGALAAAGRPADKSADVLDAGCGTGLCGPLLAPHARRLVGVDLSRGMLDRAAEKQLYDELVEGELTHYLRTHPDAFDIIVSADTLVYFGRLDEMAQAAAACLRPGGLLVFTVEAQPDGADDDFTLQPHGRFTHRRGYVTRVLREAGLQPAYTDVELRLERGVQVPGLLVTAERPAEASAGPAAAGAGGDPGGIGGGRG